MFTYNLHGDTAVFHNNSTGNGSLSYVWNFGDGDTSHAVNPIHVYDSSAVYTVCVYVTNTAPNGTICKDSFCICVCICHKDSSCDQFLNYLQNQGIGINTSLSPTITFTPPIIAATDIVRWDYTCDGIVDLVTTGNTPVTHNYGTNGNYVLCARIERIVNGDTCWATLTKYFEIKKPTTDPCKCDSTFNSNVAAGFATSTSGSTVTFVPLALKSCDTVKWDFGDGSPIVITVGNASVTHTYSNINKNYFVCMMVQRAGSPNCRRESCRSISPTAIEEITLSDIKIYPNPTRDMLMIEVSNSNVPENTHLTLSDMTGRKVADQIWLSTTGTQHLDMASFSNGVYILSFLRKDGTVINNHRVIKY